MPRSLYAVLAVLMAVVMIGACVLMLAGCVTPRAATGLYEADTTYSTITRDR